MFHLSIVTAEKTIYEGDIHLLVVPTPEGELGIMTNHHPLVGKLGPGAIRLVKGDQTEERLFTNGGYFEVNDNKVILLADALENIATLQVEEARAARERAQKMLSSAKDDVEFEKLEEELRAQMIRERLAGVSQYRKN